MNIKIQEAGVWVKASEEIPENYKDNELINITYRNHKGIKVPFVGSYDNEENAFFFDDLLPKGKEDFYLIEWLKPINGYLLTEDELQEFALQAKMSNLLPKQFIQSITK